MSRDNDALGAGYDAWKTTPPDEREASESCETACCHADVPEDAEDGDRVFCVTCGEMADVVEKEPYDPSADCAGGGDGPED